MFHKVVSALLFCTIVLIFMAYSWLEKDIEVYVKDIAAKVRRGHRSTLPKGDGEKQLNLWFVVGTSCLACLFLVREQLIRELNKLTARQDHSENLLRRQILIMSQLAKRQARERDHQLIPARR